MLLFCNLVYVHGGFCYYRVMKLNDKQAVMIIFGVVLSPLIVCLLVLLFGVSLGEAATLAAMYLVFGLVMVLVVGWAVSGVTKNSKNATTWLLIGYCVPAIVINIAILFYALTS